MLGRIFPRQYDNASYRGHWSAIWLLAPIALIKLAIGVNSIVATRLVATHADGIAVDSFGPSGAEAVLSLFARLGLFQLMMGSLGVIALVRYRAMIPLVYLLLLLQQLGNRAIGYVRPMAGAAPGGADTFLLAVLGATILGLVLSLAGGSGRTRSGRGETAPR